MSLLQVLIQQIKLINPRGRVLVVDNDENTVKKLLKQGFYVAPSGVEAGKSYNPVFDKGKKVADELKKEAVETRATISSQVLGDVLGVICL